MHERRKVDTPATVSDAGAMGFSGAALSDDAMALLGFQRTKQISRTSRISWEAGDPMPLRQEARDRREEIFFGALVEVGREYQPLRDYLSNTAFDPKSVIDIGCGQAVPDLFLQRDFKPQFTLVDIERTAEQYHSFAASGAGYASLSSAKALLHANGAAATDVTTINPAREPAALNGLKADMVVSFYSCGFHYPVDEYADLMVQTLEAGGVVCLDLRRHYLRRRPGPLDRVLSACKIDVLYDDTRSHRVAVRG